MLKYKEQVCRAILILLIAPMIQLVAIAPQSQAWNLPTLAALQFGGTGIDGGYDTAIDSDGNIITVGLFGATVDFDNSPAVFNLTSVGGYDGYITKNDKNGKFLWAKQFGGSGNEITESVVIDSAGNIIVGGTIAAGANVSIMGESVSTPLQSPGVISNSDGLLLKLAPNGSLVWKKLYQTRGSDAVRDVTVDPATGEVYALGSTNAPTTGATSELGLLTSFTSQGSTSDIFVDKVAANRTAIWTGSFGAYAQDQANSIAFGGGNVYLSGAFGGSITGSKFATTSATTNSWITSAQMPYTGVSASANLVGYVLQINAADGVFGWSKTFGSNVSTHKTSLRTVAYNPSDGSIWVGGSFNGSTTWTNTGVTSTRTSTNDAVTISNSLVAKITSLGVTQSVWNAQSCGTNQVNGIAITGAHEIVVTGNFQSISSNVDCIFEPITIPGSGKAIKTLGTTTFDGYVFKMSETLMAPGVWALGQASINWIKTFGKVAAGNETGNNVTIDASGMVYVTGNFGTLNLVLDETAMPAGAGQLALKGGIDGFVWKLSPLGGSAISVPDAPTGITATLNGTTASVAFTPPANSGGSSITSYTVTAYDGSGAAISPAITVTGASSPISVPNLASAASPGNSYKFKVKATNAIGTGAETSFSNTVAVITPSAPGAPTIGAATFIGTSSSPLYSVSFTPPANTGSAPITSYTATLYMGGVATAFTVSGNSSPLTFSKPAGAPVPSGSNPYTFVVTATNSVGTSSPSSQSTPAISSNVSTSMTLPSAPRIDTVTVTAGSTSASIVLTAPTTVGTQAFAKYRVVALVNGVATGIETTTATTSSPVTLNGLTTGVAYTFIAYAINYEIDGNTGVEGISPPSNEYGPVTPLPLPLAGAPTGLSGTTSLTPVISWTAPSTGGAVSSYTVTLTPLNGGAAVTCSPAGTATTCTVSPAGTAGKIYSVSVVANNASGSSPAATATISMPTAPSAPTITQADVSMKNHSSFGGATGRGTISFSTPADGGSAITSYTIKAYYGSNSFETLTATSSPFTFPGNLHSSSCYTDSLFCYDIKYFTVIATNAIGDSPESDRVAMLPGQTGIVKVQMAGNTQMTVRAEISTFQSEATKIRIYALNQKPGNEVDASVTDNISGIKNAAGNAITPTDKFCDAYAPTWTCTVVGLSNNLAEGVDYWFIARAINNNGYAASGGVVDTCTFVKTSDPATCITSKGKTTQDPPVAPTGVTASVSTAGAASVNWSLSSGATGYRVVATPVGGGAAITKEVNSETSTVLSPITGLTAGTQYTFAVYAINAGGSSAYSAITPAYAVGVAPAAPSGLSVVKSSQSYVISFTAPTTTSTAPVTSYTFTATSSTGQVRTVETSTVTSPYTFTGFSTESSWSFTITSNSGAGSSAPSAAVAVRALSVKAQDISVTQETAVFTFPVKYFDADNLENLNPDTENTGWVDPICNIPGNYSTSTPAGTYTITCASANGGSLYDISGYTTATLTVTAAAPQMPTGVSASLSGTSASISFTPGANSSGATYAVVVYANGVLSTITATGTSSPITVTGLTPGVVYSFGVKATNSVGTSATSSLTNNARLLQKVFVIPNAQTVSAGSSLVSFTRVYQTTAFNSATSVSPSFGNPDFSAPNCNISPAYSSSTAAGSYDITCSGGNGGSLYTFDYSYTNSLLVTANTSMPAAPSNLAVTSTTSSSASVSFTPPTVPVSPAVTTYTVTATPIGGGTPVTSTITAPASAATIGGLSSATTYKFQIVANSSGGASMPATASLTTSASSGGGEAPAPLPVTPSAPSAPSQVTAAASSGAGSTSAVVSFVPAPATAAGTTFTVTAFVNGVATLLTASGTTSPITIQGLTPGVTYTFKVTASNTGGTSAASAGSVAIVVPVKNTGSTTTDKPTKNPSVVKTASLKIYFESNSWTVNSKSRKDIQAFVAAMKKRVGPFTIKVVGMVEPTRIQPISVAQLSKSRANSVARLLKAAGLQGKYEVKGGGLSTFRGPKSRYTQIVVSWKS
jgi:outer membrane protein OmpA-like peptidoglycan-associated protein